MNIAYSLSFVAKFKTYLSKLSISGAFFAIAVALINAYLLITNKSWIFHPEIVVKHGDQIHYFELANNISNLVAAKSLYTLGYPLLYLFIIMIDGDVASWQAAMPYIITFQAFVIFPAIIYLIFRNLRISDVFVIGALLLYYYYTQLIASTDPLTKYTALGLISLSEPIAILCLLLCYQIFFRITENSFNTKSLSRQFLLLALFTAYALMTRQTLALLIAPIYIYFLQEKQYRICLKVMSYAILFYLPQLIWNYWVSRDILFNGYAWWNSEVAWEMHQEMIYTLYNITGKALFSLDYFTQNSKNIFPAYFLLLVLLVIGRFWKSKIGIYLAIFTLLNVIFYLSYWWSAASGLIDRFLLPNYALIIFFISKQLKNSNTPL